MRLCVYLTRRQIRAVIAAIEDRDFTTGGDSAERKPFISVSAETYNAISHVAQRRGESRSAFVDRLITESLEKLEGKA